MDKHKLKHRLWLRLVMLLNFILLTVPFALCWYGSYAGDVLVPFYRKGYWLVVALFTILYVAFGHTYDAFALSNNQITEMVYSQGLALLFANGIMYIVLSLLSLGFVNVMPLLLAFIVQVLLAVVWSFLMQKLYFATFPPERTAIIYDAGRDVRDLVREHGLSKKYEIVATVTLNECLEGNMKILEGLETVFICGVDSHNRNVILKYCVEQDIRVLVLPRVGDVIMSGAKRMHMFHLPFLHVERYNPPMEYLVFKRFFDLFISALMLVIALPAMLITAIAIKIEDRGPVMYRQRRLTKDGKEFMILKFRSMCVDAEMVGGAQLSTGVNDDRVTKVGRFIRKIRVDELPQLWNIFRGDMSIVGPRPERPEIATQYMETLPEFKLRLQAKAGLTGYAQVYGKYNTTPYDKLQMDLMYIANPNIIEDLRIIMATIKILFLSESTEGVVKGQKTAAVEEIAVTRETEELITVIIPVYNAERFLGEAIESVLNQTYKNIEVLIIDDCSKDGSLEIAKNYEVKDNRVRVIVNEHNCGAARTRNVGINEAKGKYIALLDGDDIWLPIKLERQIELIHEERAQLVYCSYDFIDEEGRTILKPYIVPRDTNFRKMLTRSVMSCSTVLIENDFLKKHLFKTDFYHEDYALWMEMLQDGAKAVGIQEVYTHYRRVAGSRSDNKLNAALQRWKIFREELKLPLGKSIVAFSGYIINGVIKYYLKR